MNFSVPPVDKAADRDTIRDPKRGARSPDERGLRRDWILRLHLRQAVAGVSSKRNAVVIYRRRGFLEVFFEK